MGWNATPSGSTWSGPAPARSITSRRTATSRQTSWRTSARYPADRKLKDLVRQLSAQSPRFVELWATGDVTVPRDQSRREVIEHPAVGPLALDCHTLIVAADDLRITVYTAEPGSDDAERLALAIVVGTQALVE